MSFFQVESVRWSDTLFWYSLIRWWGLFVWNIWTILKNVSLYMHYLMKGLINWVRAEIPVASAARGRADSGKAGCRKADGRNADGANERGRLSAASLQRFECRTHVAYTCAWARHSTAKDSLVDRNEQVRALDNSGLLEVFRLAAPTLQISHLSAGFPSKFIIWK